MSMSTKETIAKNNPSLEKSPLMGNLFQHIQHPKKKEFLERYPDYRRITDTCLVVGIDQSLPYIWLQEDEEFKEAWVKSQEIARQKRLDKLEPELERRALASEEKMSSTVALIFALKSEHPDKYQERGKIEHVFAGNIVIKTAIPRPDYTQIDVVKGEAKELPEGGDNAIQG